MPRLDLTCSLGIYFRGIRPHYMDGFTAWAHLGTMDIMARCLSSIFIPRTNWCSHLLRGIAIAPQSLLAKRVLISHGSHFYGVWGNLLSLVYVNAGLHRLKQKRILFLTVCWSSIPVLMIIISSMFSLPFPFSLLFSC